MHTFDRYQINLFAPAETVGGGSSTATETKPPKETKTMTTVKPAIKPVAKPEAKPKPKTETAKKPQPKLTAKPKDERGPGCVVAADDHDDEPPKAKPEPKAKKPAKPAAEPKPAKAEKPPKAEPKPVETWQQLTDRHRAEIAAWRDDHRRDPKPTAADLLTLPGGIEIARAALPSFIALRDRQHREFFAALQRNPLAAFRHFLAVANGDRASALALMGIYKADGRSPLAANDWRIACDEWLKAHPLPLKKVEPLKPTAKPEAAKPAEAKKAEAKPTAKK